MWCIWIKLWKSHTVVILDCRGLSSVARPWYGKYDINNYKIELKLHYNITTSTTTSTTETSTIEASTTTPDDVVVIPNPGRSDDLVDPKEDSNITINIQQSSVFPWLVGILALIILLSMLACCIYFSSKRRIRFIQSKNSNSGLIATKSESHLSSDSMDNASK